MRHLKRMVLPSDPSDPNESRRCGFDPGTARVPRRTEKRPDARRPWGDEACDVLKVGEMELLQDDAFPWHLPFKGSLDGLGSWIAIHLLRVFLLLLEPRKR